MAPVTFRFAAQISVVRIVVFDVAGEKIADLAAPPGTISVVWDWRSTHLAAGIYVWRAQLDAGWTAWKALALVR